MEDATVGAFSGMVPDKVDVFQAAHDGTLFLKDVKTLLAPRRLHDTLIGRAGRALYVINV
jgi:hypothetical protein